jgi:manganese-dependent inorganic pyrophosphatase
MSSSSSPNKRARTASPTEHDHHAGGAEALRLSGPNATKRYDESSTVYRHRTNVENVVLDREVAAHQIASSLPKQTSVVPQVDLFLPEALKDAVFVGHLVTDLDSVAGAIGAAAFYGGTAALASDVNSETEFALKQWGVDMPPRIEDVIKSNPEAKICLVDHQQTSQMNPCINPDSVVGVIDHHALQSKTIVTDRPIYIDIRPWGSMSTIVAHTYLTHGRRPTTEVAGMLLCAILSDTLNLMGPTTTEWDRMMVAVLADLSGVDDIQYLASQQFKAKSRELAGLSAHGLVNGDQKEFSFENNEGFKGDVGFAVVETTDDAVIIDRLDELLPELVACKKERKLDVLFLAVVNIVELKGTLVICGPSELSLAKAAFGSDEKLILNEDATLMSLGKRVSRKKDYIPEVTRAIKAGWRKPLDRGASVVDLSQLGCLEVDPLDPHQRVVRKGSILQKAPISPGGTVKDPDVACVEEKKVDG